MKSLKSLALPKAITLRFSWKKSYLKTIFKFHGKSCNSLLCSSLSFYWKPFLRAIKNEVTLNKVNNGSPSKVIRFSSESYKMNIIRLCEKVSFNSSLFLCLKYSLRKFSWQYLITLPCCCLVPPTALQQLLCSNCSQFLSTSIDNY